jgi:hypothetical protein
MDPIAQLVAAKFTGTLITSVAAGYLDIGTGAFVPCALAEEVECAVYQNAKGVWCVVVPNGIELDVRDQRLATYVAVYVYDRWVLRVLTIPKQLAKGDYLEITSGFEVPFPEIEHEDQ